MKPTPETLKILKEVVENVAPSYVFGYHTPEDMIQEAYIMGLEGLKNYRRDKSKLKTFLYHHVRNRLKTMRYDQYAYIYDCPYCDSECEHCSKYKAAAQRKLDLFKTGDLTEIEDHSNPSDKMELDELFLIIESHIPVDLRGDYLKLKHGAKLKYNRKQKLLGFIRNLISEKYNEG